MAPKMGTPVVTKLPEASTITPIELACLVQQYLMENCFPKALQEFQSEAAHLLATVRTPKSMRSLTVILSEYINLKMFEANAVAEKARTDQLLQSLYGVLEGFKPGSSKDFVASQSSEPDKKALSQQSSGKENARLAKGKKPRKSNGAPPSCLAPPPQSSSLPPFHQTAQPWPQSGQGTYMPPPLLNFESIPGSSPGNPPTPQFYPRVSNVNVYMPQANASGHSPGASWAPQPQPPDGVPPVAPFQHSPGTSVPPLNQEALPSVSGLAGHQSAHGAPGTSLVDKPQNTQGNQGSPQLSQGAVGSSANRASLVGGESSTALLQAPGKNGNHSVAGEQLEGGSREGTNGAQTQGVVSSTQSEQRDTEACTGSGGIGVGVDDSLEGLLMTTPEKAPRGPGSRDSARGLISPLKSPHAGRKGTPRKRKTDNQEGAAAPKRVSPSRALFGGKPNAGREKQPKKALFADDSAKGSKALGGEGQNGVGNGALSGVSDQLASGEEPMGEADFRALVVDTFSKDLDLPSRIAGHITQVMNGGAQGFDDEDPLSGLGIPGDASDWGAVDGAALGDTFFEDDGIPVDDILAAITSDPHVSQLLDSLAATPISMSGFDDFATGSGF